MTTNLQKCDKMLLHNEIIKRHCSFILDFFTLDPMTSRSNVAKINLDLFVCCLLHIKHTVH